MAENLNYLLAMDDFQQARQQAVLEQLSARLSGKSDQLLSFDEVRKQLHGIETSTRTLQEIPLDAIVGSVGRYNDFTRKFLPKEEISGDRWARVMAASDSLQGLPPIEVYQIGEAYFVLDGNHRVSVARQLDMGTINAYVVEIKTRVPLSAEDDPDSLILKAEYTRFLEQTHFDEVRPEANLILTAPGKYPLLEEHLRQHQYYLGVEQNRPIRDAEAVASFYDTVYSPVVEVIRSSGLLREFPDRTEADLYLWLSEHQAALQEALAMEINPLRAAADLAEVKSSQPERIASRIGRNIKSTLIPDELDPGPPVGTWRETILEPDQRQHLFEDILVAINGQPDGWLALEQALVFARQEQARIHGLHVIADEPPDTPVDVQALTAEFEQKCQAAGLSGRLNIDTGRISQQITERSRWNDLVVINLRYPPGSEPLDRLGSGIRKILRRISIPILLVPQRTSALQHALLAFDGSPASCEALYLSAYLVCAWQIKLTVLTVSASDETVEAILKQARDYLQERGVPADFIHKHGSPAEDILAAVKDQDCDWILTGSYGLNPLLEVVWGSTLDAILRDIQVPILISR
ncbi:MAG: universal stress protein [Anaerolineales bacterium]